MKRIALRNRDGDIVAHAVVDDEDYERASARTWHRTAPGYAARSYKGGRKEYLHRFILGLETGDGIVVDHIDADPLNNTRANLRVGDHGVNGQNRRAMTGCKSRHRGVAWHEARQRWRVTVRVDGRNRSFGEYVDELEAARVASAVRRGVMPFSNEERDLRAPDEAAA